MHKDNDPSTRDEHVKRQPEHDVPDAAQGAENRDSRSPAHWQGDPVPTKRGEPTRDVGFDKRGAGRAKQYGHAAAHGQRYDEQERLPVRGWPQPDGMLLDVVDAEFRQSGVDVQAVVVTVKKGVVRLTGHVFSHDDKSLLERLAANCPGTIDVDNNLNITSSSSDDAVM